MNSKRIAQEFIPPVLLKLWRRVRGKTASVDFPFSCPVCQAGFDAFERLDDYYFEMMDKYQTVHSMFSSETMNLLKYYCPSCRASDRVRLYSIYLAKKFSELQKPDNWLAFLDIAPDINLQKWIKSKFKVSYRSLDLFMEGVDDKGDITDLHLYGNDSFDFILCSHVLEHVVDDRRAISELFRIMKPGGLGIIMVPINISIDNDLENPDYQSVEDRWKYYGQHDHVRLYSKKGFISKLLGAGFEVRQHGIEYFGQDVFKKFGIHPRSVLYVVEK